MENEREVLLEVNHLNVTYGSGRSTYHAVQDASFKIYKGETFGLVGESGSGKTTIGRAILRILRALQSVCNQLFTFLHNVCHRLDQKMSQQEIENYHIYYCIDKIHIYFYHLFPMPFPSFSQCNI